jgi:hypothetical protein
MTRALTIHPNPTSAHKTQQNLGALANRPFKINWTSVAKLTARNKHDTDVATALF